MAHIVCRMALSSKLADHAVRIKLRALNRCTSFRRDKPTPPPGSNKRRDGKQNALASEMSYEILSNFLNYYYYYYYYYYYDY